MGSPHRRAHPFLECLLVLGFIHFCASLVKLGRFRRRLPWSLSASERTRLLFDTVDTQNGQVGGAGGSSTLVGLERLDAAWHKLRHGGWAEPPQEIVFSNSSALLDGTGSTNLYDIAICGGTLGIFYAAALQASGKKCCIVERGKVQGRPQEWNIARKEISTLVRMKILTEEELQSCIDVEFNPVRVGFNTDTSSEKTLTFNMWTSDVLNLGVSPKKLIRLVKQKFQALGGVIFEDSDLSRIVVHSDCACLDLSKSGVVLSRLVIDCMGNASPISRQVRGPVEPDGVCIVVGSCAKGFDAGNNTYSDLIYTDTKITKKENSQLQYFWEAFPTGGGPTERTTYLFTYMDAKHERPSVSEIFDDYWTLLPRYQGREAEELKLERVLYGLFPTYRGSPLATTFDRVLAVGDASGIQSPLSFGGFGSLTRHMDRVCGAVTEALDGPSVLLSASNLARINAYQPNLAACWMFQRAMSVPIGKDPAPDLIVGTLSNSFSAMQKLGDTVSRPFLQDVLQFKGLLATLVKAAGQDLLTPFKIVPHVGVPAMGDFLLHFAGMCCYTVLHHSVGKSVVPIIADSPLCGPETRYQLRRQAEAWKFGAGLDYYDHDV